MTQLEDTLRLIPGYDPFETAEDCHLDAPAAQLALDFFPECLHHVKGELAGQPFILEPWEQAIIGNLFGWKQPDGRRRYSEAFIYVPRKNGKSCLVAGIICYVMFCDHEPGAEIYSAAADREQACLVRVQVEGMIRQDETLDEMARIYQHAITYAAEGTTYKAISAEAGTKHGYNSHLVIIDEVHAQPNRELVDVLETSTGSRSQPIVICITTSDFDRPSICNEKHEAAGKVRDGIIQNKYLLPVIYEASVDDDWADEKVWYAANPNLGVSLRLDYLQKECKKAQNQPSYENTFRRLHLNVKTTQDVVWISMQDWDKCNGEVDVESLKGCKCYAGLDLSSTRDTSSLVLAFPLEDEMIVLLPFFWIPGDSARERENRDRVPYSMWAAQNLLDKTPGKVIDYRYIRRRVTELCKLYDIQEIAFDPYNATQLATQLLEEDGLTMIQFRQGFISMNEPSKEFERRVLQGNIKHGGHPVLRWQASNVMVTTDTAGCIKPVKPEHKDAKKIDGIVAAVMAVGRTMLSVDKTSVYETRGIITI